MSLKDEDIADDVIESRDVEEDDLTTAYLKGYADAEERYRKRIKELEGSILIYKNAIPKMSKAIETVLNMLKQNSAELAEKSAEIKKKDKQIDLMAERIEWLCKSNGILLDKEHDENFTQQDIKKYFERKASK